VWTKIFSDNLFKSVDLVVHLKEIGYDWVRTIRQNLLSGRELMEEKELKRFRMGNVDWTVEKSTDVCLVRWYDNKAVTHVSNYVAVDPRIPVHVGTPLRRNTWNAKSPQ